jgi:hypothetical protein
VGLLPIPFIATKIAATIKEAMKETPKYKNGTSKAKTIKNVIADKVKIVNHITNKPKIPIGVFSCSSLYSSNNKPRVNGRRAKKIMRCQYVKVFIY